MGYLLVMKTSPWLKGSFMVAVAGLLATGCVVREHAYVAVPAPAPSAEVVVTADPPAPLFEVIPAPQPGFYWVQGAWTWREQHWVWVRGHWSHPPHPGAMWVGGHYRYRGGARVWVEGRWR